jgi:GDP-L-fucose synthase
MMNLNSKIYVAGHNGLVGSAIVRQLKKSGYRNILTATRSELDLTNQNAVGNFFSSARPEYVFDAAAKVGGIHANDTYSAAFIYENLMIQNNLIHNSWKFGAKKFLFLGSVCIYPKYAPIPVKENSLMTGELEPTNRAYAIAKIAGIEMCQAYYKQYGFRTVCLMPCNLYGPNDNFDANLGHVIPAMFTKFAKRKNNPWITFWGTGTPKREFMYSDDMADACIFMMKSEIENGELINVGSGYNISIKDLSEKIAAITEFDGDIRWDTSRPDGTPNRPLDSSRLYSLGWKLKHSLDEGLQKTYEWFKKNTQGE